MNKIFWTDPYLTKINTQVSEVNDNEVLFEDTIAYSFSGAQESDKAFINGIEILDSRIDGKKIYYTLPDAHNLMVGDEVEMTTDWDRRYRLMRLHFCAELVLEIVTQKWKLKKIGAHIAEGKARIDFATDNNVSEYFPYILNEFHKIVDADLSIQKDFSDIENQRRFWKIDGFAKVPCGGTHVKSTKEVGYITLKRDNRGKGMERIVIKLVNP